MMIIFIIPRWRKEIWWTLVHKQKSSRGTYWPTQVDILRETTFPPLGAAAPSILHALQIDQSLPAHTRTRTGVPQKI